MPGINKSIELHNIHPENSDKRDMIFEKKPFVVSGFPHVK